MNKTVEAMTRGYLLFRVNGGYFLRYDSALAWRRFCSKCPEDVSFEGLHLRRGWVGFHYRKGPPPPAGPKTREEMAAEWEEWRRDMPLWQKIRGVALVTIPWKAQSLYWRLVESRAVLYSRVLMRSLGRWAKDRRTSMASAWNYEMTLENERRRARAKELEASMRELLEDVMKLNARRR